METLRDRGGGEHHLGRIARRAEQAREQVALLDLGRQARRRSAAPVRLRPGPDRVLWLDATAGDRLGEAVGLESRLRAWWPRLERLDPRIPRLAPGDPYAALLVTSHRPLTVALAQLLEPLTAALGTALAAGHPSLAGDLERLLGPGWEMDALADCSAADFAPLQP